MNYPSIYHNLLVEAGLIGEGFVELRGFTSHTKNMRLDDSNTWREGFSPEIDTTEMPIFINPTSDGINIRGDWRVGLTADHIKVISEQCSVPNFKEDDFPVSFNHGHKFDLSKPNDMALYRIALHNNHIARNINEFNGEHQAYWYNIADEVEYTRKTRKVKAEAYSYINILNEKEKKDLLAVLFHEEKLRDPVYSPQELEIRFMDYVETHAESLVRIKALPDMKYRVFLIKAIEAGGITEDFSTGTICYADGKQISPDFESCVLALSNDKNLLKQVMMISEKQRSLFVDSSAQSELEYIESTATVVKTFNTKIERIEDIKLWGSGALKQYLAEHKFNDYEVMSIEDLQKKVKEIHLSKLANA